MNGRWNAVRHFSDRGFPDRAPLVARWDTAPNNGCLEVKIPTDETPGEEGAILEEIPGNQLPHDIRVFVVACPDWPLADGYGITDIDNAICWVHGSYWGRNKTKAFLLRTIAHEIGHVFLGEGHPDSVNPGLRGKAPLPGTQHTRRLMCSGGNSGEESRMLVKGEWDVAEVWLKNRPRGDS